MAIRRQRAYSPIAAKRRYLFSEQATVYEVTLALEKRLKQELRDLNSKSLINRPTDEVVSEIVQRYTLDVPVLHLDRITELPAQQIKLQVPAVSQNRVFAGRGPHFVPATAFSIRVPFTGDPNLFRYSASGFGIYIEAELADDAIILTHTTEQPNAETIKKDFDARMSQIENALQFVREQAQQWNSKIPNLVRPAIEKWQETLKRDHGITLGYPKAPEPLPPQPASANPPRNRASQFDVFLSHASEDKESIARPLYDALTAAGISVWFDEAVLKLGDSLSAKIDEGLAKCRYGIVIISPSFLDKRWTQRELAGLVAREVSSGVTKILPIWHDIDHATLVARSPTLADKVAGMSSDGMEGLVKKILDAIR